MHVLVSSLSSCIRIFYMQSVLHILFPGWLMGADPQPKHLHGVYLWNFRGNFSTKNSQHYRVAKVRHLDLVFPKELIQESWRNGNWDMGWNWHQKKTATGQSKINVTSQTLERLFISLFISLICNSLQQRKASERRRLFPRALGDRTFQELINEFSLGDRSVDVQLEDLLAQRKHNGTRKWTRAKGLIGCKKTQWLWLWCENIYH
jgi:hypothetical protein